MEYSLVSPFLGFKTSTTITFSFFIQIRWFLFLKFSKIKIYTTIPNLLKSKLISKCCLFDCCVWARSSEPVVTLSTYVRRFERRRVRWRPWRLGLRGRTHRRAWREVLSPLLDHIEPRIFAKHKIWPIFKPNFNFMHDVIFQTFFLGIVITQFAN